MSDNLKIEKNINNDFPGPFLITGCYRSGTEYITQLINNHPKIIATMYTVSFMRFSYKQYDPLDDPNNVKALLSEVSTRLKERWDRYLSPEIILRKCNGKEITYALLYNIIMRELYCKEGDVQWAEKIQLVWTKIPDFLDMFPKGKAIHVIRDPRSVLASFKKYTYAPPPAYLGAIFNCLGSMLAALKYKKKFTDNYILIRYEDVASDPESQMRKIFDLIGYSAEHNVIDRSGWLDSKGKQWRDNTAFEIDNGSFNIEDSINRWKKHLNETEVAICEWICGEMMERFGYELLGIKINLANANGLLKAMFKDKMISSFLKKWVITGEGVEQFPTDPLDPSNWEENVVKT